MNEEIYKLLDELSYLSRETKGGSFTIQHYKDTGLWKVVFGNCVLVSSLQLKETTFDQALKEAIRWIKSNRRPIEIISESYTLFK